MDRKLIRIGTAPKESAAEHLCPRPAHENKTAERFQRLILISSHPVPCSSPLFRLMARQAELEILVKNRAARPGDPGPFEKCGKPAIHVEMVMDAIGGKSFVRSAKCLGPTGRLVVYGISSVAGPDGRRSLWRGLKMLAQTPRFNPLRMMYSNLTMIGVHLGRMKGCEALLRKQLGEIFRMYVAGEIKPVIGKIFPLEQAAEAHRYIHARKNIGKVVLTVP